MKERLHRGNLEVTLALERSGGAAFAVNRDLVGGYLRTFREVAEEFGVSAEPDLNAVLKMPGALNAAENGDALAALEQHVTAALEQAIERLNHMREEEGRGALAELRNRMTHLSSATHEVDQLRGRVLKAYQEKLHGRMQELLGSHVDHDRILQEAAILAERSDIQEELVRMKNHIQHFLSAAGGRRRGREEAGFPAAGDEPRGQHPDVEDERRGGRGAPHHRAGAGHEVGNRESTRAGTEPGMSGNVFIISAPSGSGKSTLTNELRRIVPNLDFSISYTTRPPRGSEQSGREYFFVSRDEFERMIREDEFLEWAEVFGNYYGTAKRFLREAAARGHDLLLDIDVQGAAQVKRKAPDAVSIFVLPPSREELERRLRRRAEADDELRRQLMGDGARPFNTEATIQCRLQTASHEIENFRQYDYILVNDRLEESIDILKSIVEAERLKRSPGAPTSKDFPILAVAERALRPRMLSQVEAVLATFDLSRLPSVSE